jgi:hypothetical protein
MLPPRAGHVRVPASGRLRLVIYLVKMTPAENGADVGSSGVAARETTVVCEDTHKPSVTGINQSKLESDHSHTIP